MTRVTKLGLAVLAVGVTACSPLRLQVPDRLAAVQPLPVTKKTTNILTGKGTLRVADHEARFNEDGARTSSSDWGTLKTCGTRRDYTLELAALSQATTLALRCQEAMSGKQADFPLWGGELSVADAQNRLHCAEAAGKGRVDFREVRESGGRLQPGELQVEGQVELGATRLRLSSVSRDAQGHRLAYLGFHVARPDGEVVAAFQARQPAQVWLSPELSAEERDAAVLAAFTLALQQTWTGEGARDCETAAR